MTDNGLLPTEEERKKILKETFRYLGYRRTAPDEEVRRAVSGVLPRLTAAIEPREIHRSFPLQRMQKGIFKIEGMELHSRSLERNLAGCGEVWLMAATIGYAPDRMAARASAAGHVSEAVIVQAAGAALIEWWCGRVNESIRQEALAMGKYLRPRFSPGYGDLPLACQRDFFQVMGVTRYVGITLTESLLMMPSKSVTALIGMAEKDAGCLEEGCEVCPKNKTCVYSRLDVGKAPN